MASHSKEESSGTVDTDGRALLFVEIRREPGPPPPTLVEAYVAIIQPRQCSSLIQRLSRELPLVATTTTTSTSENDRDQAATTNHALDFSHLKRVKKITNNHNNKNNDTSTSNNNNTDEMNGSGPLKKKQKTDKNQKNMPLHLEILLREVAFIEQHWNPSQSKLPNDKIQKNDNDDSNNCVAADTTKVVLQNTFDVPRVEKRMVPGRPPESHQEWQEFQTKYWPTNFFAEQSKEHLEQQLQLTQADEEQMTMGMEWAIQDYQEQEEATTTCTSTGSNGDNGNNNNNKARVGAAIVNPLTGEMVATSNKERKLQQLQQNSSTNSHCSILQNPLATSVLLAIQGVSRLERQKAISDGMASSEFQKGQYLCTGYDVYTTHEPTVFEAMAMVHSRVRRLVFGHATLHAAAAGGGGAIQRWNIHDLSSTNHHYRAFQCQPGSALWTTCQSMK